MQYEYAGNAYRIIARPDAIELCAAGETWFTLRPESAVDPMTAADRGGQITAFRRLDDAPDWTVLWTEASGCWDLKEYRLTCRPDAFSFQVRVHGRARVRQIRYFAGSGLARFPGSSYEAAGYATPLCLACEKNDRREFTMAEEGMVAVEGFTPPMFSYAFNMADAEGAFGIGVETLAGNCAFDRFAYRPLFASPNIARFYLSLDFDGHQSVDGEWAAPALVGFYARDAAAVFTRYAQWHYQNGCARRADREAPRWWRGPFFCGWNEQSALNSPFGPLAMATQLNYQKMSDRLDELGLRPSLIVIDDKWQKDYGSADPDPDKWPDMRAFVDAQHEKGRRVALWFKCWSAEGLPADECVTRDGEIVSVDPTSPAYRHRLRRLMRRLLSDANGCLNCDGLKLDYAGELPHGADLRIHEPGVYGVALLKRLFDEIYAAAKAVKADALINASCCHPLFAASFDQARLHDYYPAMRDAVRVMKARRDLFQIAVPGILIDTDGGPAGGSRRDLLRYLRAAPEIGVPDLYVLTTTEEYALSDADWREVAGIWRAYQEGLR